MGGRDSESKQVIIVHDEKFQLKSQHTDNSANREMWL
jgi:hypothetical protein